MGPTAATKVRPPVSRVPPEPVAHNPVALAAADLAWIGPVDLAPMASLSSGMRLYEHGLNKPLGGDGPEPVPLLLGSTAGALWPKG